MSAVVVAYDAVEGEVDEPEPVAQAPPGHEPDVTASVLQTTARTTSPEFGSDQVTAKLTTLPAVTGSGESVAEVAVGGELMTVKVPVSGAEQLPETSQAKA